MRYRIVNKKRFITFCLITVLSIFFLFSAFGTSAEISKSSPRSDFSARTAAYRTVTVAEGDTLWDIARAYGDPKADIRRTVYELQKINGIDDCVIYPGQELLIEWDH